jgi:hypothetical protein
MPVGHLSVYGMNLESHAGVDKNDWLKIARVFSVSIVLSSLIVPHADGLVNECG